MSGRFTGSVDVQRLALRRANDKARELGWIV